MARIVPRLLTAIATLLVAASPAAAQAWTFPAHTGAVTFVAQEIDHVGRMDNEGHRKPVGKAVNFGVDLEVDYAFTDHWSISTTMPYILSKYKDTEPPPFGLPFQDVDECRCWNDSFADFGVTTHYTVINRDEAFVLTPFVSAGVPSHPYDYAGEAVVGRRLKELRFGTYAGQRLDRVLPGLSVQASYGYTVVGQVEDVPNNRSNGSAVVNMAFPRGFSARGIATWQRTHGGLRFPCDIVHPAAGNGDPICGTMEPLPEVLQTEFHRMLRDNYLHVGAGVGYGVGLWELSMEALVTTRGSNSHDVHVFSITAGRSFELGHR